MRRDIIVIGRTRRLFLAGPDSFFAPGQKFGDIICHPASGVPEGAFETLSVSEAIERRKHGALVVEHNGHTGFKGHYRALKAPCAPDSWLKEIWEHVKASCVHVISMCMSLARKVLTALPLGAQAQVDHEVPEGAEKTAATQRPRREAKKP